MNQWNQKTFLPLSRKLREILFTHSCFEDKQLYIKLWNRFWKACEMYNSSYSYQVVLQELFGAKQSDYTSQHKKNKDFNTLLNIQV